MKRSPVLALIALLIVALASCKNKSGLFIPADAMAVIHINPSSLSSKVSWDDVKNSEWFKDLYKQADDSLARKVLDNPEASGLDTKGDFFFFAARQGKDGYNLFEGLIKDAAAFEAMNKKFSKQGQVQTDGDFKFIGMDGSSLVVWNDKRFAYINGMAGFNRRRAFDDDGNEGIANATISADSLRLIAKNILTNEGNDLQEDERFANLIKEKGDMHIWVNQSASMADLVKGPLGMMKAGSLLEGNATGAVLNFEDGRIVVKAKSYFNKELARLMEKHEAKDVSEDVLNRIPSQNVAAVMATNLNPQTLKDLIKAAGVDGILNSAVAEQGLTFDQLFAAFNGQFVVAVSDLQPKDSTFTVTNDDGTPGVKQTRRKTDFNILVASGVAERPIFQKMLDLALQKSPATFAYKVSDQWFVAAKTMDKVDAFMSGQTTKQPWAGKISGHPFGMYIDLQKIMTANLSDDSTVNEASVESAKMWQDIVATGGEVEDGVSTMEFVVNLVDKKTNSLKQLNAYANRMNEVKNKLMKKQLDMHREWKSDSSIVLPAPPAIDEEP